MGCVCNVIHSYLQKLAFSRQWLDVSAEHASDTDIYIYISLRHYICIITVIIIFILYSSSFLINILTFYFDASSSTFASGSFIPLSAVVSSRIPFSFVFIFHSFERRREQCWRRAQIVNTKRTHLNKPYCTIKKKNKNK